MLPSWNPDRLGQKIPFNCALCGGRRMGKSTAVSDLLTRLHSKFELVICLGSAACNPTLKMQLELWYDERFFFSEWSCPLMQKLLVQQEELKSSGVTRNVLILVDDVVLTSKAEEQLCHLAMRGRHFNISLMCCSVSYTSIPKSCRRSLDVLLLFSCPMSGDLQTLTWEFTRDSEMARFAVNNLGEHECLVLETLTKKQCLYVWRANLTTARTLGLSAPCGPQISEGSETPSENPSSPRPDSTLSPSDCIRVSAESQPDTSERKLRPRRTRNS